MELFKRLWKEHKKEIVISGLVVIGAVTGYIIVTKRMSKDLVDLSGKAVISWDPNSGSPVSLEKVREFLTLTSDMNSKFAIFREGTNLDEYCIILLS